MKKTIACPGCGSQNAADQQFCGSCGAKLAGEVEQQTITCPGCGSQNPASQQFCGSCGAKLAGGVQPVPTGVQQVPTGAQQVPTRVMEPFVSRQQIEVKPTWGLTWGLFWRLLLLNLVIGGVLYLVAVIVMLAFGFTYPIGF